MNWDELSMSEKSDLMKTYIRNGVTSLDTMRGHFNSFATGGTKKTYKEWVSANAGYDYERYFNENYQDAISRLTEPEPRHFTDKYKLPSHSTFSNESVYSTPKTRGGIWVGEDMFMPSAYNAERYPWLKPYKPVTEDYIYSFKNGGHLFEDGGEKEDEYKTGRFKSYKEDYSPFLTTPVFPRDYRWYYPEELNEIERINREKSNYKYIGGTPVEARYEYHRRVPVVMDSLNTKLKRYDNDPVYREVGVHRFNIEGFPDYMIKAYNEQKFMDNPDDKMYNTFDYFGTDNAGRDLDEGKYSTILPITYIPYEILNEKNQTVYPAEYINAWEGMEIMAADLKNRKDRLSKTKAYQNASAEGKKALLNGSYNMGLQGALNWFNSDSTAFKKRYKVGDTYSRYVK